MHRLTVTLVLLSSFLRPSLVEAAETPAPIPLTLSAALERGVAENLVLLSERAALKREAAREHAVWESYSPTLLLRSGFARARPLGLLPVRSSLTYAAGVSWRTPIGTELSAETQVAQGLSGAATERGPERHQGALILGLAQPLLRDAWLTGAALPLREAELQAAIQRELFRQSLNNLLVDVESAYWDLAVAAADVDIKTRSLARAKQQYEDTAENIRRGILANIEIYVVEENVVFFEQELVQARLNHQFAQRRLAELLSFPPNAPLVTADPLAPPEFAVPLEETVLKVGLESNPRILAQRLRHSAAELRESYARNQALPTLDLTASVSFIGSDDSWGAAVGETLSGSAPETLVGLRFALPLDRGAVGAGVDVAEYEASRQKTLLLAEEQNVRTNLLDGINQLQTSLELLSLSARQLELAELKLNAELEKYEAGISTLADVVRFQRELDNASIRLRQTLRAVFVGRARLLASQGTLHDAVGVGVQ